MLQLRRAYLLFVGGFGPEAAHAPAGGVSWRRGPASAGTTCGRRGPAPAILVCTLCLAATSAPAHEAASGKGSDEADAEGRQDPQPVPVSTGAAAGEEGGGAPPAAVSSDTSRPSVLPQLPSDGSWGPFTVGVRAGALVPLGARHASYSEAVQAGIYAAGSLRKVAFEIGVDAYRLEAEDVDVTGDVLSGRLDVLLGIRTTGSEGGETYCHFGPRVLVDLADTRWWGETTELAAALGGGIGLRRRGGGWDARLSIDGLVGSGNIRGFVNLNVGFTF